MFYFDVTDCANFLIQDGSALVKKANCTCGDNVRHTIRFDFFCAENEEGKIYFLLINNYNNSYVKNYMYFCSVNY